MSARCVVEYFLFTLISSTRGQWLTHTGKAVTILKVSSRFRIILPKTMRANLRIRPGDKLHAIEYAGRISLIPMADVRVSQGSLEGMDTTIERDVDRL